MSNRPMTTLPGTTSRSNISMRRGIFWCSLFVFLLLTSAGGAAKRGDSQHQNKLFQVSTLDALSLGLYQGALSFGDLEKHGDFGLGTFDSLDGEMVALDGRFYQVRSDGTIERVHHDATTPFAVVTTFDSDLWLSISQPTSLDQLTGLIDQVLPSKNFFYAIKVHGSFMDLTTRSVPKQYVPYPPLSTAISQQALFVYSNLRGTLVGFRSPDFVKGINQAGYHFHFISDDEKAGGHALTFTLSRGIVEIEVIRENSVLLPENPAFLAAPLPLS
jgi:acetolactate decarboxylase